jgi:hypothetical protein
MPYADDSLLRCDQIVNYLGKIAFCIPAQSAKNKRSARKCLMDCKAKFFISQHEVVGKYSIYRFKILFFGVFFLILFTIGDFTPKDNRHPTF